LPARHGAKGPVANDAVAQRVGDDLASTRWSNKR
jgi:hypothetical protein